MMILIPNHRKHHVLVMETEMSPLLHQKMETEMSPQVATYVARRLEPGVARSITLM